MESDCKNGSLESHASNSSFTIPYWSTGTILPSTSLVTWTYFSIYFNVVGMWLVLSWRGLFLKVIAKGLTKFLPMIMFIPFATFIFSSCDQGFIASTTFFDFNGIVSSSLPITVQFIDLSHTVCIVARIFDEDIG